MVLDELHVLRGHTGDVTVMAVTPDSMMLVTGSGDTTACVWHIESGRRLHQLCGHAAWVTSIAATPDSTMIVTVSADSTACVWDLDDGKLLRVSQLMPVIELMSFAPTYVLAITQANIITRKNGTYKVWSRADGKMLRQTDTGSWLSEAFAPDGSRVACGHIDDVVRLWNLLTGQCEREFRGHLALVRNVTLAPNGERLVTRATDGTTRVWSLDGRSRFVFTPARLATTSWTWRIAISPDSQWVVTDFLTESRSVAWAIWSIHTGDISRIIHHTTDMLYADVSHIRFSPRGDRLVICDESGRIASYDLRINARRAMLAMVTSPLGKAMATHDGDGHIYARVLGFL